MAQHTYELPLGLTERVEPLRLLPVNTDFLSSLCLGDRLSA